MYLPRHGPSPLGDILYSPSSILARTMPDAGSPEYQEMSALPGVFPAAVWP